MRTAGLSQVSLNSIKKEEKKRKEKQNSKDFLEHYWDSTLYNLVLFIISIGNACNTSGIYRLFPPFPVFDLLLSSVIMTSLFGNSFFFFFLLTGARFSDLFVSLVYRLFAQWFCVGKVCRLFPQCFCVVMICMMICTFSWRYWIRNRQQDLKWCMDRYMFYPSCPVFMSFWTEVVTYFGPIVIRIHRNGLVPIFYTYLTLFYSRLLVHKSVLEICQPPNNVWLFKINPKRGNERFPLLDLDIF